MKIVVNKCYGGFSISDKAAHGLGITKEGRYNIRRDDPTLIEAIERFGSEYASGLFAQLEIVDLPSNMTDWMIEEYDGYETVYYVVNGIIHTA